MSHLPTLTTATWRRLLTNLRHGNDTIRTYD